MAGVGLLHVSASTRSRRRTEEEEESFLLDERWRGVSCLECPVHLLCLPLWASAASSSHLTDAVNADIAAAEPNSGLGRGYPSTQSCLKPGNDSLHLKPALCFLLGQALAFTQLRLSAVLTRTRLKERLADFQIRSTRSRLYLDWTRPSV